MTFSQQYSKTLERVYDLTKEGRTEEIANDFSIPEMFGAWSSIFWALPQLDRFGDFNLEDLKKLVQALVKSHCGYKVTTNQYLRTETIEWIAGKLVIKTKFFGTDPNEALYAEYWTNRLFLNPEMTYEYNTEIGRRLSEKKERNIELTKNLYEEKQNRLRKEEEENELRKAGKKKAFLDHLDRNQKQKEI